jgi:hypothetical protein
VTPEPSLPKPAGAQDGARPKLPPASFDVLVDVLAAPALVHLGFAPHPVTGRTEKDPEQAKWVIDMLHVLEERTRGNLSAAEKARLDQILHQFRTAFASGR